jgi:hypothetical protein
MSGEEDCFAHPILCRLRESQCNIALSALETAFEKLRGRNSILGDCDPVDEVSADSEIGDPRNRQ